jgi:hypothetical protein
MIVTTDTGQLIYLLWGFVLLLLAALLCWQFFRMQSLLTTLGTRIDQVQGQVHSIQRVLRDVHDEGDVTRRLEQDLEGRVTLLSRQQEQLMLRDTDAGPYFQAIRHAQQGATLDELLARTNVSRGEAELILALHGGRRNTAAQNLTQGGVGQ